MTLMDKLKQKGRGILGGGLVAGAAVVGGCSPTLGSMVDLWTIHEAVEEVDSTGTISGKTLAGIANVMENVSDTSINNRADDVREIAYLKHQKEVAEAGRDATSVNVNVNQTQPQNTYAENPRTVYSRNVETNRTGREVKDANYLFFSHSGFKDLDGNEGFTRANNRWGFDTSEFKGFEREVSSNDLIIIQVYSRDRSLHDFKIEVYDPKGEKIDGTRGNLEGQGKLLDNGFAGFYGEFLLGRSGPGIYTFRIISDGKEVGSLRRELVNYTDSVPEKR